MSKKADDYKYILDSLKKNFTTKWDSEIPPSSDDELSTFETLKCLGAGSFGRVLLVQHKKNGKYYAMKMLSKTHLYKHKQIDHSLYEKKVLLCVKFPFIVSMEFCYKDNSFIYFIMPFVNGGEMFTLLRKLDKFDEDMARFYAAQVALGLEFLHYCNLLYRDLKPENVLIDAKGFLKIADLGFCKLVTGRTWTLCGTPEYIAPEILLSKGYGAAVDWWSFGVLIYEMCAGYPPFTSEDQMRIYEKIVACKYRCPTHFSHECKDVIFNLLQLDLSKRFGNMKNGVNDIKNHKWFKSVNWTKLFYRQVDVPYKPTVKSPDDTSNFDQYEKMTEEKIAAECLFETEFKEF